MIRCVQTGSFGEQTCSWPFLPGVPGVRCRWFTRRVSDSQFLVWRPQQASKSRTMRCRTHTHKHLRNILWQILTQQLHRTSWRGVWLMDALWLTNMKRGMASPLERHLSSANKRLPWWKGVRYATQKCKAIKNAHKLCRVQTMCQLHILKLEAKQQQLLVHFTSRVPGFFSLLASANLGKAGLQDAFN